jgi:hypothetical protein
MAPASRHASIGLLQALDDEEVFGRAITLYPRQREPLAAVDGGVRFLQLAWGRRAGKDVVQAIVGLWHCLPRPELDELAGAHGVRRVLAFATTEKQARELILAASSIASRSPRLAPLIASQTDMEIRFRHGVVFSALPCNARGDRGRGASCILLNEAAHHFDGVPDGPRAAETLFGAVVPSVAQYGALGTVVIASTPAGDSNHFARLRDDTLREPSPARAYFTGATWDVNPRIRREDLEEERRLLGADMFAQEYEASFLSGAGAFLDPDAIEQCVREGGDAPRELGTEWLVANDPAFVSDVYGAVAIGRDPAEEGCLIVGRVCGWEGRRPDSFEEGRARQDELLENVVELAGDYGARRVITDVHKAREIRQRLGKRGITVTDVSFTGDGRREVFAALRLAIDTGRVSLPREPQLLAELRALRVRYRSQGQTVELPRVGGSHCDRAVALAIGVFALGVPSEARILTTADLPVHMQRLPELPAGRGSTSADMGGRVTEKGSWIPDAHPAIPRGTPGWQRRFASRQLRRPQGER